MTFEPPVLASHADLPFWAHMPWGSDRPVICPVCVPPGYDRMSTVSSPASEMKAFEPAVAVRKPAPGSAWTWAGFTARTDVLRSCMGMLCEPTLIAEVPPVCVGRPDCEAPPLQPASIAAAAETPSTVFAILEMFI